MLSMIERQLSILLFAFYVWAQETRVDYSMNFHCGQQPVTGDLIITKGGVEFVNIELTRRHQNLFHETYEYVNNPVGEFEIILRTACGSLSKFGEMCYHEYKREPYFIEHGTYHFAVLMHDVNLTAEIFDQSNRMVLKCV